MPRSARPKPYVPVKIIHVSLWGHEVGAAALDERLGYYAFNYTEASVP